MAFIVKIRKDDNGLFIVTSPQFHGVYAVADLFQDAYEKAEAAIEIELALYIRWGTYIPRTNLNNISVEHGNSDNLYVIVPGGRGTQDAVEWISCIESHNLLLKVYQNGKA